VKKKLRKLHILFDALLVLVVLSVVVFFAIANLTAYRPQPQEVLRSKLQPQLCLPRQFSVTTWNIGGCGLGKEADFFYDGGKMVRPKRSEVEKNLQSVKNFLQQDSNDFILLQEVDVDAKRSHHLNQLQAIAGELKTHSEVFAFSYKAWHVPLPIFRPLGRVQSGLATFGRCAPYHAVRHTYPGREAWPEHIFQLQRCFVACRYTAHNGKDLVLINTHNSAFDNGGKRRQAEMKMLRDFVEKEYHEGSYVVVGGDFNQTPPCYSKKVGTKQYTPHPIATAAIPEGWQWVCDTLTPSMRFTNAPYTNSSLTSVTDFFLVSPNVKVLEVATHPLGFTHSDHNPVTARLELQ
jgi:endonuclease/exonuclease/phosphatase family metal-dependent hydrolase